jgi:hypothetical protein
MESKNMDPQECLNEIFRLLLISYWENSDENSDAATEAAQHLLDLIEWHKNGGALPDLKVALDDVLRRRAEMARR